MSKKQTAVSWLIHNMPNISEYIPLSLKLEISDKFQQAKQLEKEQIVEAYTEGYCNGIVFIPHPAEQYYSETYE